MAWATSESTPRAMDGDLLQGERHEVQRSRWASGWRAPAPPRLSSCEARVELADEDRGAGQGAEAKDLGAAERRGGQTGGHGISLRAAADTDGMRTHRRHIASAATLG